MAMVYECLPSGAIRRMDRMLGEYADRGDAVTSLSERGYEPVTGKKDVYGVLYYGEWTKTVRILGG